MRTRYIIGTFIYLKIIKYQKRVIVVIKWLLAKNYVNFLWKLV